MTSKPTVIGSSVPDAVASPPGEVSPEEFLNRDTSWLEFNRRVLHEALDSRTPLLERVRFLGIFSSNLDEYFMKRVGGLKRQMLRGWNQQSPDGMTPAQTLAAIRNMVVPLLKQQGDCFTGEIRPLLAAQGIHLLTWADLNEEERANGAKYFSANVFPVLTPLAVDPGNPFPFISNLSTSLGVVLHHPDRNDNLFARVKVPEGMPGWVQVNTVTPAGQAPVYRMISLTELIRANMQDLFPDMAIVDTMGFRITRNADLERDEEDADDLMELIEDELRRRRFANAVRVEHGKEPNAWIMEFLTRELGLSPEDVYEMPAELDYPDLKQIADLNVGNPSLKYEPWTPIAPPALADDETDIFSVIRSGDVMVHMPYESFNASVERFVRQAVDDPKVLAIKMSLYRTGDGSPFIPLLIRAAEQRKQVACLVELKARFDEERNIQVAGALEKAGVHVVYGVVGLKTHAKTTLVVRQDPDGIRSYCHIGTGNYHAGTARLYTDLGLLTCDPEITHDVVELFHYLTGRSLKRDYRKLLVAPVTMQPRFLEMIDREAEHARQGRPAHIVAKMNSLEERKVVRALYRASKAGVKIDLIVRGFCTLRPGVKGLSENIRVSSVIGRFLEHSRIFYFRNGQEDAVHGEFYIGSADWMYRNLLARVEAIVPIEKQPLKQRLWDILQVLLNDNRQGWDLLQDGTYVQRNVTDPTKDIGSHQIFMNLTRAAKAAADRAAAG
ncbi:polyphosphate kinase 1 [Humisphaera borealis]|uniref:Polyphosphate kinase n=1 Tax=Humisphaera borealis TaxID=2807512 RepID=A0A7M2X144_9BACT|nr:polyphosphate kinase 1 [Humisphaera borealis]QOV91384.1 polyphosphate kinase 1 [Humisphaera borealis]